MPAAGRAAKIRLVLFDVDGVLTDGKIVMHADGTESKVFDIKDGTGIVWAQRLGLTVGFLSARSSDGFTPHLLDRASPDSRNLGAMLNFTVAHR